MRVGPRAPEELEEGNITVSFCACFRKKSRLGMQTWGGGPRVSHPVGQSVSAAKGGCNSLWKILVPFLSLPESICHSMRFSSSLSSYRPKIKFWLEALLSLTACSS